MGTSMQVSLAHFLRTGVLGDVALGMNPVEVESLLGAPQQRSHKLNPLIFKYGGVELTFHSTTKLLPPQLVRIAIALAAEHVLTLADWPSGGLTSSQFREYLTNIGIAPVYEPARWPPKELMLPSGVRVGFVDGAPAVFDLSRRTTEAQPAVPLTDDREPSAAQIRDMLAQASRALDAGLPPAALVLAWAALEATLRRTSLALGLKGRVGVSVSALVRELVAAEVLSAADAAFIENTRQARTSIVHGLVRVDQPADSVVKVIDFVRRVLDAAEKREQLKPPR